MLMNSGWCVLASAENLVEILAIPVESDHRLSRPA